MPAVADDLARPGSEVPGLRAHLVVAGQRTSRVGVALDGLAVHRRVGQRVRRSVLRPRHPGEGHRTAGGADLGRDVAALQREPAHVFVLDLPAAGHLLHHEFGVHPHLDVGSGVDPLRRPQAGDHAGVLRHVVAGDAHRLRAFGQDRPGVGVTDQGAVAGTAGIAARSAVGLDDERTSHPQIPDSGVRTRIRRHSSQRITSSSGAEAIRPRSTWLSSSRQPPHRRWASAAAPRPPLEARILS